MRWTCRHEKFSRLDTWTGRKNGLRFYQRVLRESDNLTKNAKSERKFGKIETRSKP